MSIHYFNGPLVFVLQCSREASQRFSSSWTSFYWRSGEHFGRSVHRLFSRQWKSSKESKESKGSRTAQTKTARFFVLQKNALQGRYQNKAAVCGSNCHELFCGSFLHLSDRRSEVCRNLWPRVSHAKMITIDADYHSYLLLLSLLVIIYITDMDDY